MGKLHRKHEVLAAIDNIELVRAKSSLHLVVLADGEKLGQLEIGRGSYNKLDWSHFAEKMNELAYGD